MTFGNEIRLAREKIGLSQEAAAKVIRNKYGVRLSSAYLSMIERGERVNLTTRLEHALRDYFNLEMETATHPYYRLPLLGAIRTNAPLLLQDNYQGYFDVPSYIQADFVLQVAGDSMIGAGILDGDYIVCREVETAQNGQIVVVLKDLATGFSELILKYYFVNAAYLEQRDYHPHVSDVSMQYGDRIVGVMEGLVRKDAPGYQVYRHYLNPSSSEKWTEVIEKAKSYGITPQQFSATLDMQWEMAKKLRIKE